jgi:putative peptidoglycan lipid II flippase
LKFIITVPSTFGMMILRYPVVNMLFRYGKFTEESASMVSYALLYQSIGIGAIGGTRVLVQMFYSLKDTKTPVWVAAVSMSINLALCALLAGPMRIGGVALAGSVSAFSGFILLCFLLSRKVGLFIDRTTVTAFGKALLASVGMGLVLFFARNVLAEIMKRSRAYNAGLTLLLLMSGVLVYLVLNLLLKNRDIIELVRIFLKRIGLSNGQHLS